MLAIYSDHIVNFRLHIYIVITLHGEVVVCCTEVKACWSKLEILEHSATWLLKISWYSESEILQRPLRTKDEKSSSLSWLAGKYANFILLLNPSAQSNL